MAAAFPGASITGAPKHHTMEIIRELEKEPRGIYTGCLGLFLPGGDFTCNLCIRTIVHHEGRCLLGLGSGVVWDSDAKEEYEETLTKASFAFSPRAAGGGPAERPTASPTSRPEEPHLALLETILLEAQPARCGMRRTRHRWRRVRPGHRAWNGIATSKTIWPACGPRPGRCHIPSPNKTCGWPSPRWRGST
jgi:hypothetical protein